MSLHAPADDIAEAQTPTAPPPAAPRKSLLARAGPLVFARILSAVITFAIPLALARAFVPEDYGTYKQLILISTTLYFVLPFGMPQSLYYFVPRASAPRPFIAHTLLFLLAAGAVGFGCMVLGAEAIARSLNNPGLVQYMPMLGVYTFALIASMPLEPALTARGRTKMAGLLYVGSDTVKAVAMTAPALLGYGLQGVVVGITVFAGVRLVATWAALLPGSGPLVDRALLVRQLRYTIPFGLAVAVAVPQKYFQQSVVSSALTPAAFAVYAVGIFQVPLFDLLYTPTSEMLMVHLAELDREKRPASEGAAAFREAILKLAWFFIPAVFFLFAVAPEFITTLFTDKYAAAVPIFRIGIGAGLLACIPVEGALRARGQTRHILVGNLVKAAISVPLVLVLVAHFGMIGGIVCWVAVEVVGKAVMMAKLPAALHVPLRELLPLGGLGRPALAAAAALVGVWIARLVAGVHARPVVVLAMAAAAYGVLYLAATFAMGARLPAIPLPWRKAPAPAAR